MEVMFLVQAGGTPLRARAFEFLETPIAHDPPKKYTVLCRLPVLRPPRGRQAGWDATPSMYAVG